jgi:hypothetical protein
MRPNALRRTCLSPHLDFLLLNDRIPVQILIGQGKNMATIHSYI